MVHLGHIKLSHKDYQQNPKDLGQVTGKVTKGLLQCQRLCPHNLGHIKIQGQL